MIKKGIEIALNVRPIYIGLVHQYVFEGPCRFGKGEELTPEYDMMANAQFNKDFQEECKKHLEGQRGINSFHEMNCNLTVIFQVKDSKDFFEKQINFGNHIPLTYGDYTEEIKLFAKSVGMEVVEA